MKKENKKSAMETANTTAQYKNPNTLYHENNEKGKMNINTAVFVLKNVLTRYDEQMDSAGQSDCFISIRNRCSWASDQWKCSDYRNEKRIRWNGILWNKCRASRRIT